MTLFGFILMHACLYALARLTGTQVNFVGAVIASLVYLSLL